MDAPRLTTLQLTEIAAPIMAALINAPRERSDEELANRAIELAQVLYSVAGYQS
jgi:hypothetical protein